VCTCVLWYVEKIWRKSAIPDKKKMCREQVCVGSLVVGGLLAKCANFWLSGQHVADMSATFPAKAAELAWRPAVAAANTLLLLLETVQYYLDTRTIP